MPMADTQDTTASRLITALLAGNESLRDRLEAQEKLLSDASEEIERLKQPEALWYETVMKMLAVAPNHVAASFNMGGRRVEITFYNEGGKTPGEVAAELRVEVAAMLARVKELEAEVAQTKSDLDAHRWAIHDSGVLDGDNVRLKRQIIEALQRKGYKFRSGYTGLAEGTRDEKAARCRACWESGKICPDCWEEGR
jgi:hypothetical protein